MLEQYRVRVGGGVVPTGFGEEKHNFYFLFETVDIDSTTTVVVVVSLALSSYDVDVAQLFLKIFNFFEHNILTTSFDITSIYSYVLYNDYQYQYS